MSNSATELKPRLLLLASSNQRRGAEIFTERLRDGLTDRDWAVDAVCLAVAPETARADLEPLSSLRPSEMGKLRMSLVRALRHRIRSFDPDVLLANGGPTLRYAVMATLGRRPRLAYVSVGEPDYWIRSSGSKILNQALLRRTDYVLAVSDRTRSQLVELVPALGERVAVAHTGVPDRFLGIDHEMAEGPLRVVSIGSLSYEKDPGAALRAVSEIPDAVLRFVGSGPLESDLRTEAAKLGVVERVDFAGAVDDIRPHLQWAHVLLLTSLTEGFPAVILEAGATGLPAVGVDVGGVVEAIVDGETGIVVPRSVTAVVGALRRLDGDRDLLARMGIAARSRVATRFKLDEAVARYDLILRRLVSGSA